MILVYIVGAALSWWLLPKFKVKGVHKVDYFAPVVFWPLSWPLLALCLLHDRRQA